MAEFDEFGIRTTLVSTKSPANLEDGKQMLLAVSRAIPSVNAKCRGRRLFPHFTLNSTPAYHTCSVSDDNGDRICSLISPYF